MTKQDLISSLYKKLNKKFTKNDLEEIYESIIEVIEDEIEEVSEKVKGSNKECVKIPGIGKLVLKEIESRIFKSAITKEKTKIPKYKMINLKASNNLKKSLNKK